MYYLKHLAVQYNTLLYLQNTSTWCRLNIYIYKVFSSEAGHTAHGLIPSNLSSSVNMLDSDRQDSDCSTLLRWLLIIDMSFPLFMARRVVPPKTNCRPKSRQARGHDFFSQSPLGLDGTTAMAIYNPETEAVKVIHVLLHDIGHPLPPGQISSS